MGALDGKEGTLIGGLLSTGQGEDGGQRDDDGKEQDGRDNQCDRDQPR